jgi:hypothetical protein
MQFFFQSVKRLSGSSGVTTRRSKYSDLLTNNSISTTFDLLGRQSSQIEEWKQKSRYFANCTQKNVCDPFGIFDPNENKSCLNCLETRNNLREKV